MPENCRFLYGFHDLQVLATDVTRNTPSGQGVGLTVIRAPSVQGAQQPRRASRDQEGAKQP